MNAILETLLDTFHMLDGTGNFCINRPPPGPAMGALDRYLVFGPPHPHNSPSISLFMIAPVLFIMGYRVLFSDTAKNLKQFSNLRFFVGVYCIITAIFFVVLATNLNIIVIVLAGLHNWIEWAMLSSLVFTQFNRRTGIAAATAWIWLVWLIVLNIPDILVAFEVEEILGIWPDFMLVLTSTYLNFFAKKDITHRDSYQFFFEGAIWHILQIFTLLFQGFGFLSVSTSSVLTFVTVLPNYWFYSEFAMYFDGYTADVAVKPIFGSLCKCNQREHDDHHNDEDEDTNLVRNAADNKEEIEATLSLNRDIDALTEVNSGSTVKKDSFLAASKNFKPLGLVVLLLSAFALSATFVGGPPLVVKLCKDVGFTCVDPSSNVWQVTLYSPTAGLDDVYADVVRRSKSPLNLNVRLFQGHDAYANYFIVLEKWTSKVALYEANIDLDRSDPHHLFRYENFLQVETTPTFFDQCTDSVMKSKYDAPKVEFPVEFSKVCRTAPTYSKITLASLTDSETSFGLDAVAYDEKSRFMAGSISFNVFFGGSTSGTALENNGFDASYGKEQKALIVQRWKDEKSYTKQLSAKHSTFVEAVTGIVSVPTSIVDAAPFEELLASC